jgi:hypothetical protein
LTPYSDAAERAFLEELGHPLLASWGAGPALRDGPGEAEDLDRPTSAIGRDELPERPRHAARAAAESIRS